MITELEKQYNHKSAPLSTIEATENEERQPARPTGRPACRDEARGFTKEDIEALEAATEDISEGRAVPTTDKPRLVTRGHHNERPIPPTHPKHVTKHDWLTFTAKEPYWVMQEFLELACPGIKFIKKKNGINGYHSGFNVTKDNRQIATLHYGSYGNEKQNEKPQITITGGGSTDYFDFSILYHYALLMEKPTITVVHIAYDDFDGLNTIESVTQAHADLKFMSLKSSKNPLIDQNGKIQPDGKNPGRTVYIGSTSSSMRLCAYEKGFETFKAILNSEDPKEATDRLMVEKSLYCGEKSVWSGLTNPTNPDAEDNDGKPFDIAKWLRLELRLKNTNREIPLDILIDPDKYYAGAYPFTEELMKDSETKKTVLFKTVDQLDLMVRIENMKAIAGSLIEDLLILGWSNDDIIEALKGGKGASQKLIRSGAYKD